MIDIKQYLKETNSVLLSEQAYKYLLEKASVIEKLEAIKTEMDIIAELEEIKAEIRQGVSDFANENGDIAYGFMCAEKIIDNHINKADCNNDCEHCEWTECPKD